MSQRNATTSIVFYISLLLLFGFAVWLTLEQGTTLELKDLAGDSRETSSSLRDAYNIFTQSVGHHATSTIGMLLMQILIILVAARTMGWLFGKIRQPAVIGEIVAGILLGPSLLGRLAPETFALIFPEHSLSNIQLLSNFGLILFMFAIGMELRLSDIRKDLRSSLVISHAGIFVPFALSLPLSYAIYSKYAAELTGFTPFALFVGIAMSITAFPVLARIIQENKMQRTHLGKLSLSTAAASDITAWLMLAAIIAISQSGSMLSTMYNLGFLIIYLALMFGVIRPLFRVAGKVFDNTEVISHSLIGVIFMLLLLSSYVTELLSMHALFGAFILGLMMPEDLAFRKIVTDKVEDVSLLLFLPLFFVSSGLQTELGLIDSPEMWWLLVLFTAVAIIGKVGGTYLSARAVGVKPKESLYLGAFMNTRGLMELVVLSIGYEMKILPPSIYAVLVLMTVLTTVMTMPMVHVIDRVNAWLERRQAGRKAFVEAQAAASADVLLSFGRAASGVALLRLAHQLLSKGQYKPRITALHITTEKNISSIDEDKIYNDSFGPIQAEAERIGQPLSPDFELSESVETTIIEKLHKHPYQLLLVGVGLRYSTDSLDQEAHQFRRKLRQRMGAISMATTESLLSIHNMLRDKMDYFVSNAPCSVAIWLSKECRPTGKILLCLSSDEDLTLLPYARTMAENREAELQIMLSHSYTPPSDTLKPTEVVAQPSSPRLMDSYECMIVSYREWTNSYATSAETDLLPETLILHLRAR